MKFKISQLTNLYNKYKEIEKKSRLYRVLSKLLSYALVTTFLLYLGLLSQTQILFANTISYKNYNVYFNQEIDTNIISILDEVELKGSKSKFNDMKMEFNIFIFDNFILYNLLALQRSSFGATTPFSKNIFINLSDVKNNKVYTDTSTFTRPMSEVITHEIIHAQTMVKKGIIATQLVFPTWKQEGYCEYIAEATALDYKVGISLFEQQVAKAPGLEYFKHYIKVKYLIEIKKLDIETIFEMQINEIELEKEILQNIELMKVK